MQRVEIVHEDTTLRLGVCRNLLIIAWLGPPESAALRAIGRARAAMSTKHKSDVGTINVVLASTLPRFTQEIRDEVVNLLRDARLQGLGTADVVLAPGLSGVTTRAFLSTSALLARSSTPHRVFSELRPAADWLAPLLAAGSVKWSVEENPLCPGRGDQDRRRGGRARGGDPGQGLGRDEASPRGVRRRVSGSRRGRRDGAPRRRARGQR